MRIRSYKLVSDHGSVAADTCGTLMQAVCSISSHCSGPAGDADEPDWMQQHTSMRTAADALAAEAARKARIAAAQARTKAAQLRRAKRKVRVASVVEAPCPSPAGHLLAQSCKRAHSMARSRSAHRQTAEASAVRRAEDGGGKTQHDHTRLDAACSSHTAGGGCTTRKPCCWRGWR
jgi:hypothetical protein